ncbi:MAG: hypothetical protein ACREDR_25380, partial [Blastocatellia bacterium]
MKITKLILLVGLMLGALLHQSDGQQARPLADQLRLAGAMPKGALLYIQARDLSAVMKRWLGSPVRKGFYDSPSFAAFSQSHLYVKLQARKADFDKALGFSLDEDRLAELAGGTSAVSIYDIGKLELVFVTEVPRTKAVATTLFKSIPNFEERSASGSAYYVHDVATDGGRLNQEFCFSYAGGKLIVTTTEALMTRALAAVSANGGDSLLADVLATGQQAKGLSTHDVTLWVDQAKLNKNRHFINYWLYQNTAQSADDSLANIESGLMDLSFAADGMHEQRWFLLKTGDGSKSPAKPITGEEATALIRFVPAGAQMVQVHGQPGSGGDIGDAISRSLFGNLPEESATATGTPNTSTAGPDSDEERSDRYSNLDARFDMDVDDDSGASLSAGTTPKAAQKPVDDARKRFAKTVGSLVSGVSQSGYCEIVRSKLDKEKPFARFERAVVVEIKDGASVDKASLERMIGDEFRTRFVISGIQPRIEWQDEAPVRFLAQSLLAQGAAYSVSGKYLILASSKEFARDILTAGS